jgi:hypothetical protein
MSKKALLAIFIIVMISLACPYSAFAKVSILNRTGDISISMPDGSVLRVGPNDALPATIPDNAVVTILSGSADVSSSDPSAPKVVCGDYSAVITAGNALSIGVDPQTGKVTMTLVYGTVEVTGPDGKKIILDDNNPSLESATGQTSDSELPSEKEIEMEKQGNSHDISPSS